ncbi:MAG: hypothetical protein LBP54_02155, partial [Campylobacteraceae bacterium]|nr:hypothetical protein [Campylobacteraceae bacterium]
KQIHFNLLFFLLDDLVLFLCLDICSIVLVLIYFWIASSFFLAMTEELCHCEPLKTARQSRENDKKD